MLPWLSASRPAGWVYARLSVTRMAPVSTCRTRARDCFSSGGAEALSKSVSRPGPGMLASCCQEKAAPGPALKSDFFPPSRHRIAPLRRATL